MSKDDCPPIECNFDTYFALPPCDNGERDFFNCSCPPRQCPDGSWVDDLSECRSLEEPEYVCWDGSIVYSFFDCPLPSLICEENCEEVPTLMCWNGQYVYDLEECPLPPDVLCWNGDLVYFEEECNLKPYECWNGVRVLEESECLEKPVECWDGSRQIFI